MQHIKNIIFDLGGVILNIDLKLTENALKELGVENLSQHMKSSGMISFFKEYEAGRIGDAAFIKAVQSLSSKALTDEAVIDAWNALLLDFPQQRIELLLQLRDKYRLFLLSNTNAIHYKKFQERLHGQTGRFLEDIFEKAYYSHTIGLCKPDVAAYRYVINANNLIPSETLFVDDTEANMPGAIEAGLNVSHIKPGRTILDLEW